MAKYIRIDCCDDCTDVRWPPNHNGAICEHPGGKDVKITKYKCCVGEGCPLPDLPDAPEPYSESNRPREGDTVITWNGISEEQLIGFVECASGKSVNVRFAQSGPDEAYTEHFMNTDLTLVFRPPQPGKDAK